MSRLRLLSAILAFLVHGLPLGHAAENVQELPPVRIMLIGDSTVASYPNPPADRPSLTGWGQVLDEFFNDKVQVLNHAVSGQSSKSFIRDGLWKKALEQQPDYVFIQFGHNDQPDKGDRSTDANADYQDYLRQYIRDTRAISAHPILVTSVARRTFQNGKIQTTLQPYADAMKKVGQEQNVPVVDLHAASMALLGPTGRRRAARLQSVACRPLALLTHGARTMAKLVAAGDARDRARPAAVPGRNVVRQPRRHHGRSPSPWTPLAVEDTAVKPWGRVYRFDRSPLPTEVVTREASVLAEPITLRGRAGGKPIAWDGAPVQFTRCTPAVVVLTGHATADQLTLSGTTTVEYDGMIRVDLALAAARRQRDRRGTACWRCRCDPSTPATCITSRASWGSVANSGFLPANGWSHGFKPFVWLGDEDRGIAWFCESDENWSPADANGR